MSLETVVTRIKGLCKERGISLKELAVQAGISETGLHHSFAAGSLRVDVLLKMCDVLGVDIGLILDEVETKASQNESEVTRFLNQLNNMAVSTEETIRELVLLNPIFKKTDKAKLESLIQYLRLNAQEKAERDDPSFKQRFVRNIHFLIENVNSIPPYHMEDTDFYNQLFNSKPDQKLTRKKQKKAKK